MSIGKPVFSGQDAKCKNVNADYATCEGESAAKQRRIDNDDASDVFERVETTEMKRAPTHACSKCGKCFSRNNERSRHEKKCDGPKQKKTDVTVCQICRKSFSDYRNRLRHEKTFDSERERVHEGTVRNTYNFPVPSLLNVNQLIEQIEFIFEHSAHSFKVNLSFGLILQNVETGIYRYFVPYYTDGLFLFPQLISNRNDIEKLRKRLSELDISNYFQKQRPNSKWKPVFVTNVLYHVHKTSFPLGMSQPLPDYIVKSKSIISFVKNPNTKQLYDDNFCFFRCLAYHRTKRIHCETFANHLYSLLLKYVAENQFKSSDVTLCKMPDLELCFETNINVFELTKDKTVTSLYKSRGYFRSKTMTLNLFEDHLSYVSKFKSYASKFQCRLCEKLFDRQDNLFRHEKTCENATKLRFPGGYFEQPKSIFDKLKAIGINVQSSLQNYPWFVTFDMEAMLQHTETRQTSEHLQKTTLHHPVSVSICSNIENYTDPKFILDPCLDSLLSQMISYMNEISDKSYTLARERWADVFAELERLENQWVKTDTSTAATNHGGGGGGDNTAAVAEDDDDENEEGFDDDVIDDDDGGEAKECNEYEPPSKEFLYAMSKENVFFKCLQNLESTGSFKVQYNDWESESNMKGSDSSGSDDDDDDDIQPFRPLNAKNTSRIVSDDDGDDDDGDDDDDDDDIQPFRPLNAKNTSRIVSDDDGDDDDGDDDDDDDDYRTFPETSKLMVNLIKRTREQFETYCHQVPVIGFNSAKYDLNLIKSKLAKCLKLQEPKQQKFVVKRNHAYMCLSNPNLRFLDMVNYLPPGTSYDKFLSTFGVSQRKSYFPYEYFTDMAVLDETSLPPKEAFYSSLNTLALLNLHIPPKSRVEENYQHLLEIWKQNNMITFRDFLEHYNNLDTSPMVEGIEKFRSYFVERNIDVFKDCISVPGAARKMLYKAGFDQGASFALINRQDEDLYHVLKSNIVGGPSIIFTRCLEAGQTNIRGNELYPCKTVIGYDANSLYVHALGQAMPCGNYIRRKKENGFKPLKTSHRYTIMYDWMEWLNYSQNVQIEHKMNSGSEKRIGPYLADGYDPITGVIYEFLGCYFHGHSCVTPEHLEQHKQRFNRTQERLAYLRSLDYQIVIIWECEFTGQVKENDTMKQFIDQRYPIFYRENSGYVNESQILDAIVNEKLFGFIEVDIQVPDTWDQVKFKPETD
ncbi:uncharacterized protein LOC132728723 [Ruditapes philippinarum]|uniref:uncharacterized protein LOC132728723 n=1 Tax=Ruditapes philippinarum TaxID=129788 RepID=UPI00295B89BD|nr:uncharacterized protein LOC132728723 [Ruditapes philippinarum]